jgi:RHS repeat-associated protein
MDRRTELVAPNGMTTRYDYDTGYRLTGIATTDLRGQLADAWSYTYDAVGNRTTKTDLTGRSETYQYDEVDRLTRASYGDGTEEAFTYDPAGNRMTRTTETGVPVANSYDVANQMLTATSPTSSETYSYDANGSVTSKLAGGKTTGYVWDAMNRLTRVAVSGTTTAEESRYYPDGSRSWFRSSAVNDYADTRVLYDPSGNPIADEFGSGPLQVVRIYGPGVDEVLGEYNRHLGDQRYMHRDALGSITAVTDTDGRIKYRDRYTAFGTRSRTGAQQDNYGTRLGFTGRENAIEGLMQYRSRYYDTNQGRFLSNDSYRGSDLTPPSLHRYTYVLNNPVKYTDPTGRIPTSTEVALWAIDVLALMMLVMTSSHVSAILALLVILASVPLNLVDIWTGTMSRTHMKIVTGLWFLKWGLVSFLGVYFEWTGRFVGPFSRTWRTAIATAGYVLMIDIVMFMAEHTVEEDFEKSDEVNEFQEAWDYAWMRR